MRCRARNDGLPCARTAPSPEESLHLRSRQLAILIVIANVTTTTFALSISEIPALITSSNHDVRAAQHATRASKAAIGSAQARRLPHLSVVNRLTRLDQDLVIDIEPKRIDRDIFGTSLSVGIEVDLPPYKVKDRTFGSSTLELKQPLYTGGRISAGITAAKTQYDESSAKEMLTRQVQISRALQIYFQAQLASQIELALTSIEQDMQELVRASQALVTSGMAPSFTTMQIQAALQELIAKRTEATGKKRLARLALRSQLDMRPTTPMRLNDVLTKLPLTSKIGDLKLAALNSRHELSILRAKREQVASLKKATIGSMLPTAYGFGKYELVTKHLTAMEPKWAIGVGIDIPLTAGITRFGELRQSQALQDQVATLSDKAKQQIPLEVEQIHTQLVTAEAALQAVEKALMMATETDRIARLRFRSGKGSSVELSKASADHERLEIKRWTLIEECNRHLIELFRASGHVEDYIALYQSTSASQAHR